MHPGRHIRHHSSPRRSGLVVAVVMALCMASLVNYLLHRWMLEHRKLEEEVARLKLELRKLKSSSPGTGQAMPLVMKLIRTADNRTASFESELNVCQEVADRRDKRMKELRVNLEALRKESGENSARFQSLTQCCRGQLGQREGHGPSPRAEVPNIVWQESKPRPAQGSPRKKQRPGAITLADHGGNRSSVPSGLPVDNIPATGNADGKPETPLLVPQVESLV